MRRGWMFRTCPRPPKPCWWRRGARCACRGRVFRRRRRCRSRRPARVRAWLEKGLIGFAQARVKAHHLFAILIAQEGLVELSEFKSRLGRDLADMIGVVGVTAGIGEMKGETIASLHREGE